MFASHPLLNGERNYLKMKQNELSIRKRLFCKQNIYLALYSVESYISNRELMDKEDKEALSRLKDKFDE